MADRFFPNTMPDFVPENPNAVEEGERDRHGKLEIHPQGTQESLMRLLSLPYAFLSPLFQRAALDLKESIVIGTWGLTEQQVEKFTLYNGTLGTAYLLFKSFQVTHNKSDLSLCWRLSRLVTPPPLNPDIIWTWGQTGTRQLNVYPMRYAEVNEPLRDMCNHTVISYTLACMIHMTDSREVSFLCGRAGICGLGAVVAKHMGDDQLLDYYLSQFKEIKLSKDDPDELLYGRAGYLWTCLFLNKHFGKDTVPSTTTGEIVGEIIRNGRKLGKTGKTGKTGESPLMFERYDERYWGAAHGLAGILHVLMEFELTSNEAEDVKGTLRYMIKNRFPGGNYPASEEDKSRDVLVHWCHGAPGIVLTLVQAAEVFGDKEFLKAAMDAAEVVWNRGLLKRVGICHGISGNTYVFLALYRLTGVIEYLYRAKAFACFLLDRAHMLMSTGEMQGGENPFSLFEGVGGMSHLFLDMVQPKNARFPGYEF